VAGWSGLGPLGVQPIDGQAPLGSSTARRRTARPSGGGHRGRSYHQGEHPPALAPQAPWAEVWNVKVSLWLLLSRRATHYFSYHHLT